MTVSRSDFTQSDSVWARDLYWLHGYMSIPTYRALEHFARCRNPLTPNIFDHCSTKVGELAYRYFAPALLALAALNAFRVSPLQAAKISGQGLLWLLTYEVMRFFLHFAAFNSQEKNYIHIRTDAKEVQNPHPKVVSFNFLGFPAGMHYWCGGLPPLRNRFEGIVKMVREQDADVVVLQECLIDGKLPENLIHAFKDKYAHFFIHIGPNGLVPESGLFIMTKYPVHDFSFTRFTDQGGGMTRGFATLKIKTDPSKESPTYAIVGAHMEAGNATEVRKKQLAQIHQAANQMKDVQLVVLAGDTNINIKSSAEVNETQIERVLLGAYKGPVATCTNKFDKQRFPEAKTPDEEWVDQIAVIRREGPQFPENQEGFAIEKVLTEQKVVPAYEDGNSQTALSDHHLLSAIIGS